MKKGFSVIAVSFKDFEKYGCPYCGYRSGSNSLSGRGAATFECGECRNTSIMLGEGVEMSPFGIGDPPVYPKLQKHPREGTPSHGNADTKPEIGGEFFRSRGIGLDITPGCFVCGGDQTMYNNIAAYVNTKEAGERILVFFKSGAWLDYRPQSPDYVQVKIGACDKHKDKLKKLNALCNDGIITEEKVADAQK